MLREDWQVSEWARGFDAREVVLAAALALLLVLVAYPLARMCIVGHPRRAWVLTEKGQRAARRGQCGEKRERTRNITCT